MTVRCVHPHTHTQLCPTLWDPMDCSPPGSSVHASFQARVLKQVAISFSRWSSWPRAKTHMSYISCIGRRILYHQATWLRTRQIQCKRKTKEQKLKLTSRETILDKKILEHIWMEMEKTLWREIFKKQAEDEVTKEAKSWNRGRKMEFTALVGRFA